MHLNTVFMRLLNIECEFSKMKRNLGSLHALQSLSTAFISFCQKYTHISNCTGLWQVPPGVLSEPPYVPMGEDGPMSSRAKIVIIFITRK